MNKVRSFFKAHPIWIPIAQMIFGVYMLVEHRHQIWGPIVGVIFILLGIATLVVVDQQMNRAGGRNSGTQ